MSKNTVQYGSLFIAIVVEVIATSSLDATNQFTKPGITALMLACYLGALYFLSIALKTLPLGIAYAIWGGLGIVLISTVGAVVFKKKLDAPAITGIAFILACRRRDRERFFEVGATLI